MKNTIVCLIISLFCTKIAAQTSSDLQQIGYLLTDALFYSEKYIIPITDAAVYQSSSGWVLSAKKKEKWEKYETQNINKSKKLKTQTNTTIKSLFPERRSLRSRRVL